MRYSNRFKRIRKHAGTDEELEQLYEACEHLAYGDTRFGSRSKPMTRLLKEFGRVIKVLTLVAADTADAHRDDCVWANHILRQLSGVHGFQRIASFAVETDYIVSCRRLSQLQDSSNTDISMAQQEVLDTLTIQEALFHEGRIFSQERHSRTQIGRLRTARNMNNVT